MQKCGTNTSVGIPKGTLGENFPHIAVAIVVVVVVVAVASRVEASFTRSGKPVGVDGPEDSIINYYPTGDLGFP